MRPTAAKEKLLERVMTLSEAEADEALRLLAARRDEAEDEWGNPSKVHEVAFGDSIATPCRVRARGRPQTLVRRGEVFWAEDPEGRRVRP